MLSSGLEVREISAGALGSGLRQLLWSFPPRIAEKGLGMALGHKQKAWVTCEPVEYLPGVLDPEVFPEPMELSVLFPLQQCVRRHFPYSLRTWPGKERWWLAESSSCSPVPSDFQHSPCFFLSVSL